jgi:hypothetical protein
MATLNLQAFNVAQYQEVVGNEEGVGVWVFDEGHTQYSTVYDIDATASGIFNPIQVPLCLCDWAQYVPANADLGVATSYIHRHLPVGVACCNWIFLEKITSMRGVMANKWTLFGWLPRLAKMLKISQPGYGSNPNVTRLAVSTFPTWRCACLFTSRPYQVLADSQVTKEYQRYTEVTVEPGIEAIQRLAGTYIFAQGPAGVLGSPFAQQVITRAAKNHFIIKWHRVPAGAIMGPNYRLSPSLLGGLCCVNDADWPPVTTPFDPGLNAGGQAIQQGWIEAWNGPQPPTPPIVAPPTNFRKGTLLLTQIKLEPHEFPVPPEFTGVSFLSNVPRCYDVSLFVTEFNAPVDPAQTPPWYGHVTVPSPTPDANGNLYYYLATTTGGQPTTGLSTIYAPYPYDYLFLPL